MHPNRDDDEPVDDLPQLSRFRLALLAAAAAAALAALAAVGTSEPVLVAVALVAGAALERYRQYRSPIPPPLRDTPMAWREMVTDSIGVPYAIGAVLLVAGAAAILVVSLSSPGEEIDAVNEPTAPDVGTVPEVKVARRTEGQPFSIGGATFLVRPPGNVAWAQQIESESAGAGQRWVTLSVEVRNDDRDFLDPARIDYRLRGSTGKELFYPDVHGAVGPAGLTQSGSLRRGESAEVQLGFRVPLENRQLALVFEPIGSGTRQVDISLRSG